MLARQDGKLRRTGRKGDRLSLGNLNDAKQLAFLRVVIARWAYIAALVQASEQATATMLD